MGFLESLLGSGIANMIALESVADAFKKQSLNSSAYEIPNCIAPRTGIQKELLERAKKVLERGTEGRNIDVAIPLLVRALKLDPNYCEYYIHLGICNKCSDKFDIALECFDKALHLLWCGGIAFEPVRKDIRKFSGECEKNLRETSKKVSVSANRGKQIQI